MNIKYDELSTLDGNAGDSINKLADGARGAVCSAYTTYRDWYHQNIGISTPPGALIEGFWGKLCPAIPQYVPPSLPPGADFQGGQCECVIYRVNASIYWAGGDRWYGLNTTKWYAPILGIKIVHESRGDTVYINCRGEANGQCQSTNSWYHYWSYGEGTPPTYTQTRITGVSRDDGQPDTCGNPPTTVSPPTPPPTEINTTVNITNNAGTQINVPISIKPQIQLPGLSLNVVAPILNLPDLNLTPQFNFNPKVNIPVTPQINFNFGLGGVDVSVGLGGDSDNDVVNNVNNTNTITNISNQVNNISNLLDCDPCELLEDIKKRLDDNKTYTSTAINDVSYAIRDNLNNLGYVEIELIKLPTSSKIIFGESGNHSMYSGWIYFRRNGFNFEKRQLSSGKNFFWAPKWADGIDVQCTHSSRCNIVYYIENKE